MATPTVFIVGADKGGVGKTQTSRALIDYLGAHGVPVRAFDTESGNETGVLKRFHPEAELVDLTESDQQAKVFDSLSTAGVTLIDVRAGLLSPTLLMLRDLGLLDMVRANMINLVVLHVLGASIASLNEIKDTVNIIAGAQYLLVKNHINDTEFFKFSGYTFDGYFKDTGAQAVIDIPKLDERANERVDIASVSFTRFLANEDRNGPMKTPSLIYRGYVKKWLADVFAQFDQAKIAELAAAGTKQA